jgi:hypothetical protein
MGKRKSPYGSGKANPLQKATHIPDLPELTNTIYGSEGLDIPDIDRRVAMPISIFSITPDPSQPRRAIPQVIARILNSEYDPQLMLKAWHQYTEQELGTEIDVRSRLYHIGDGDEDSKDIPALSKKFLALVALATSIRTEGLTNPITIIGDNPYQIETGERRWLAYHLLNIYADESDKWIQIPAIVVDGVRGVWRQAIENNQREPLTAIEMARQLAILLMDVYTEQGVQFHRYEQFNHERDFYSQVADGVKWRVPRGMGEQILVATGLGSRAQLQQYRDLLNLSAELWDYADEHNLPERQIRELLSKGMSTVVDIKPPTPPPPKGRMAKFWANFELFSKKNVQIASRAGEAERRQMADALRKLADDLEKTK